MCIRDSSKVDSFDLYEQKRLTREHHDLKEQLNVYTNKLHLTSHIRGDGIDQGNGMTRCV